MRKPILSMLAVLAMAANMPASAATISSTVNVNQYLCGIPFVCTSSVTVTHNVPNYLYTGGLLTISLSDDSWDPSFSPGETFSTSFGVGLSGNASGTYSTSLGVLSLLFVNLNDYYKYTLTRESGDFWFNTSTLALDAPFAPTGVPEPGSLMLLGAGLLGLSVMRRRRKAE